MADITNYIVQDKLYSVIETETIKAVRGADYNYEFNKKDGAFVRWGTDLKSDPVFSPIGPEIMDIEISIGGCSGGCEFCYKNNTENEATNMTFDTFREIIDSIPRSLSQVAFGITDINTNPDFFKMMWYCRQKGIIPNFTLTGLGLTDRHLSEVKNLAGAVAVSAHHGDKELCYDTVERFVVAGIEQTNIHIVVSHETIPFVYEVINDIVDQKIPHLNALVLLGVKPKGRAVENFNQATEEEYDKLIKHCLEKKIRFGFDSCSAPKFERWVTKSDMHEDKKKRYLMCSESCESSLFSLYCSVYGLYWICSFAEDIAPNCLSATGVDNFLQDVWYNDILVESRNKVLGTVTNGHRLCTVFPEINQ